MLYGLTERQVAKLNAFLRPANQGRDGQRPRTYEDHHWVKLSSTTASSGRYPGHFYTRDADGTMTQIEEVWISFVNGTTPTGTSSYYYGRCSGFANGRPVFDVVDQSGGGSGGSSNWILHHYKIEYSDFSGAGLTDDILLETFGNSTVFSDANTMSHYRVPVAFAASGLSQAFINIYATDGSNNSYTMFSFSGLNVMTSDLNWSWISFSRGVGAADDHTDFGQPVELRASISLSGAIVNNLTAGEFWVAVTACTLLESL